MLYSVFDYRAGKWNIYEGVGEIPASGRFRAPVGPTTMPECIAARLPADAQFLETATSPRGTIATTEAHLGALELEGKPAVPWLALAAGVLVGRWLWRRFG